jgi:hypothetical protein
VGTGEPNLARESSVATRVIQPSVDVRFEPVGGIAQVEVGNRIEYAIAITNTGRQTLTDLKLLIESANGLPEAGSGTNSVENSVPMLQPGQTSNLGVVFNVQSVGEFPARIKVLSGAAILAERTSTVFGTPAKPKLPGIDVTISFPESVVVGSKTKAVVSLKNTGKTNLTGIRVAISSDSALRAIASDIPNNPLVRPDSTGKSLNWTPRDMMAGVSGDTITELFIEYEAQTPVAQAAILVQATCNEQVQDSAQATTRIVSSGVQPPPAGGVGGTQPRSGSLRITLNDFDDPTNVGKVFRYALGVTNNQNLGDSNIRIQLKMPQEIELLGISMLTGNNVNFVRNSNGIYEFEVEKFLGPGQELQYVITARGVVARNQAEVAAAVSSDSQPNVQEVKTTTTINPSLR